MQLACRGWDRRLSRRQPSLQLPQNRCGHLQRRAALLAVRQVHSRPHPTNLQQMRCRALPQLQHLHHSIRSWQMRCCTWILPQLQHLLRSVSLPQVCCNDPLAPRLRHHSAILTQMRSSVLPQPLGRLLQLTRRQPCSALPPPLRPVPLQLQLAPSQGRLPTLHLRSNSAYKDWGGWSAGSLWPRASPGAAADAPTATPAALPFWLTPRASPAAADAVEPTVTAVGDKLPSPADMPLPDFKVFFPASAAPAQGADKILKPPSSVDSSSGSATSAGAATPTARQGTIRHTGHRAAGGPRPLLQTHLTAWPRQPPHRKRLRRSIGWWAVTASSRMQEPPAHRHRACGKLCSTRRSSAADRRQGLRHVGGTGRDACRAHSCDCSQFSSGGNGSSRTQEGVRRVQESFARNPESFKLHIGWAVCYMPYRVTSTVPCVSWGSLLADLGHRNSRDWHLESAFQGPKPRPPSANSALLLLYLTTFAA